MNKINFNKQDSDVLVFCVKRTKKLLNSVNSEQLLSALALIMTVQPQVLSGLLSADNRDFLKGIFSVCPQKSLYIS